MSAGAGPAGPPIERRLPPGAPTGGNEEILVAAEPDPPIEPRLHPGVPIGGPDPQVEQHHDPGDRGVPIEGRKPFPYPRCASAALKASLLLKLLLTPALVASELWLEEVPGYLFFLFFAEITLSNLLVFFCCRWEDQHHWTTVWSVLTGTSLFLLLFEIIEDPAFLAAAAVLGRLSGWNAAYCNLTEVTPIRLPPFLPMREDPIRKPYGWLGERAARRVPRWRERRIITFILRLTALPSPWFECLLAVPFWQSGGMRLLPEHSASALHLPFVVAIFLDLWQEYRLLVWARMIMWDWRWHTSPKPLGSARAYMQDEDEVITLDQDPWGAGGAGPPACRPLTISMVAFMPNEEDGILKTLEVLRVQCERYPGELMFLFCWNSPTDHKETVSQLDDLARAWTQFRHYHVRTSTSKAENLNFMLERVTTEWLIFLDSDTLVSTQTLIYANTICEDPRRPSWVQGRLAVPRADVRWRAEGSCTCRPFTSAWDAESFDWVWAQEFFGYSPFFGHGGMWRTEDARRLGFDHRTVGEDFDIALRAHSYFGYRGYYDPKLLFSERTPPTIPVCVKQRVRWFTTMYQFRPNVEWALHSPLVSRAEALVLLAKQIGDAPLPLQSLPEFFTKTLKTLLLGQLFIHIGEEGSVDPSDPNEMMGLAFILFIILESVLANGSVLLQRFKVNLMKPRVAVFLWFVPLEITKNLFMQFLAGPGALHNYLWGYNVFTVTARAASKEPPSSRASSKDSVSSTRAPSKDSARSTPEESEVAEEAPSRAESAAEPPAQAIQRRLRPYDDDDHGAEDSEAGQAPYRMGPDGEISI